MCTYVCMHIQVCSHQRHKHMCTQTWTHRYTDPACMHVEKWTWRTAPCTHTLGGTGNTCHGAHIFTLCMWILEDTHAEHTDGSSSLTSCTPFRNKQGESTRTSWIHLSPLRCSPHPPTQVRNMQTSTEEWVCVVGHR
jgi:hypothetical protein